VNRLAEHARLLLQQGRYDLALTASNEALAQDPQEFSALIFQGSALLGLGRKEEALASFERTLGLYPDQPICHYHRALALHALERKDAALESARAAVALDPEDVDFVALEAGLLQEMHRWEESLQVAERGLALDPEQVECINLRARALAVLGRANAAHEALDYALSRDPENAHTHANLGWNALRGGRTAQAMGCFREALRIDPANESANAGVVEAMAARNPIYRPVLRFFLWMQRFTSRQQMVIFFGLLFGTRIVANIGLPGPVVTVVVTGYILFALSTWFARPFSLLLLRLDAMGRQLLQPEDRATTNRVLFCLGWIALFGLFWIQWHAPFLGMMSLAGATFLFPAVSIGSTEGGLRRVFWVLLFGGVAVSLYALTMALGSAEQQGEAFSLLKNVMWAGVLSSWLPTLFQR